jgi:hypothetical protein
MSGIAPKQNAFKFKIAPHKQKSIVKCIWQGDEASLTNEALCLSTPKHNDKSGTGGELQCARSNSDIRLVTLVDLK